MGMIEWVLIIIISALLVRRVMPTKSIQNISVQEAKRKFMDHNVQFIDVRTPGEYKANHRKPFENVPLANLASKLNKLDKEKEVVVICQSGMRSVRAAKILKKHGFEKIFNVKGGMSGWI